MFLSLKLITLSLIALLLLVWAIVQRSVSIGVVTILLIIWIVWNRNDTFSSYHKFSDPKVDELYARLSDVFPEMSRVTLSGSNKSFTINKRDIYLCIKDDAGEYYPDNMLVYVLLHELAHTLCDKVDDTDEHSEDFKQIFSTLLARAEHRGLYDPKIQVLDDYCGYDN